jgi:hypothetical protein
MNVKNRKHNFSAICLLCPIALLIPFLLVKKLTDVSSVLCLLRASFPSLFALCFSESGRYIIALKKYLYFSIGQFGRAFAN